MKGKIETRRRILQAAKEVFLAKGFLNAKIDDFAKLSNISHGTFYIYYRNKNELLCELIEITINDFYQVTEEPWGRGDIYNSLKESISGFLVTYQKNLEIIKAWREVAATEDNFMKLWEDFFEKITKRIEKNIISSKNKGLIKHNNDPSITAQVLSGMVEHAAYNFIIKGKNFEIGEISNTLTDLWYSAIYQ